MTTYELCVNYLLLIYSYTVQAQNVASLGANTTTYRYTVTVHVQLLDVAMLTASQIAICTSYISKELAS